MLKVPNYTDDEVEVFHPLFQSCVEDLLIDNKNLFDVYECIHHKKLKSGRIPDFIIRNKKTKQTILICEIKRTISDVFNYNFNEQVRSYADDLVDEFERPFYLLTNLEVINFYKYKSKEDKTIHHLLDLSPISCLRFDEVNLDTLKVKLKDQLKFIFESIFFDKNINWKMGLSQLDHLLSNEFDNFDIWMNYARSYLRYYIEGSFAEDKTSDTKTKVLNFYTNSINSNFKIDSKISKSCFEAGKTYKNGDDFANIVQSQVCAELNKNESGSIIPTDNDVCRLMTSLIKKQFGDNSSSKTYMDPGCGIGNILISIMSSLEVNSSNIIGNDINPYFAEASRLRVSLSSTKAELSEVNIFNRDLIELDNKIFDTVDCLVMNPPFKRGANHKNSYEKKILKQAIKESTKTKSILAVGNAGLETLHLEYLCSVLKKDTLFITIFPLRYLRTVSGSSSALREFLLEKFGLTDIIYYPHIDIFSDVKKSTVILAGRVNVPSKNINIIKINKKLEQINLNDFDSIKNHEYTKYDLISKNGLAAMTKDGWINLGESGINYINRSKLKFSRIENYAEFLPRGNADNKGGSDIIFPSKETKIGKKIIDCVSRQSLILGLKRAISLPQSISKENFDVRSLNPRVIDTLKENKEFIKIVDNIQNQISKTKAQYKKKKSSKEILEIIEKIKIYPIGTILIPRGIRKNSVISLLTDECVVSTNFVPIKMIHDDHTKMAVSFLSSIYGQIQFELFSNNERGLRKCEIKGSKRLLLPCFDEISLKLKEKIVKNFDSCNHYTKNLLNLVIDERDNLWSEALFEDDVDLNLQKTLKQIKKLIENRST